MASKKSAPKVQQPAASTTAYDDFGDADDSLDNLASAMGEDFGFGFSEDQGDPNVVPQNLPVPKEKDLSLRQSDQIVFTFPPIGQVLTKLVMQAQQIDPKKTAYMDGFKPENGGLQREIRDAAVASEFTFAGLQPSAHYIFRLVATNPAGSTEGPVTPPIATVELAPSMGDKSGWLVKVEPKGTLTRKLSFKKKSTTPDRYWFVLEGALLSWYDNVNGKDVGRVHMKDVSVIEAEDSVDGGVTFAIRLQDKNSINLIATSSRPDVTDAQYCRQWVMALRKAQGLVVRSFGSAATTGMMF